MATPMDVLPKVQAVASVCRVPAPNVTRPTSHVPVTPPACVDALVRWVLALVMPQLQSPRTPSSAVVPVVVADAVLPEKSGVGTKCTKRQLFPAEGSSSKKIRCLVMPPATRTVELATKGLVVVHSDLVIGLRNCYFEGRVLSRYGLYVKGITDKDPKKQNLCCELLDICGEVTVNLGARTSLLAKNFTNALRVRSWVRVSNFQVKAKESWDCGTSPNSIELTAASTVYPIEEISIPRFLDTVETSNTFSCFKLQSKFAHGTFALAIFKIREDADAWAIVVTACTSRAHDDKMDIRIWRQQVTSIGETIQQAWDGGVVHVFYMQNVIKGPEGCGGNTGPETLLFPIENEAQRVELVNAGRLHAGYASSPLPMKCEEKRIDTEIFSWLTIADCKVKGSAFVCQGCKCGTVTRDENNLPVCLYCGKHEEPVLVGHLNVLLVEYDESVSPPQRLEYPMKLPCHLFPVAFNYELGEFETAVHSNWAQHCNTLSTTNKFGIWSVNYRGWVTSFSESYEADVLEDVSSMQT